MHLFSCPLPDKDKDKGKKDKGKDKKKKKKEEDDDELPAIVSLGSFHGPQYTHTHMPTYVHTYGVDSYMLVSGCVSTHLIWLVHPTSQTGSLAVGIVPTQQVQTVLTPICACLPGQRACQTRKECCVLCIKVEAAPQFSCCPVPARPTHQDC